MQFLKTLFWVMVAVIAVVFAFRNWMRTACSARSSARNGRGFCGLRHCSIRSNAKSA